MQCVQHRQISITIGVSNFSDIDLSILSVIHQVAVMIDSARPFQSNLLAHSVTRAISTCRSRGGALVTACC